MPKFNNYFDIKWLIIAVVFTATVVLLSHFPQDSIPSPLEISGFDKLEHVFAYGVITLLFILSLRNSSTLLSTLLLFFAVLGVTTFDELTQPLVSRTANLTDWLGDISASS